MITIEIWFTCHMSTATLFGAYAVAHSTRDEADETLKVLKKYGIYQIGIIRSFWESSVRSR